MLSCLLPFLQVEIDRDNRERERSEEARREKFQATFSTCVAV